MLAIADDVADARLHRESIQEPVLPHPLVVVDLRQVRPPGVRDQHDHDRAIVELASDLQRGEDSRAGGAAGEKPLFPRQPPRRQQRVAIRYTDPAVDHRRVERTGIEVLADALDLVRVDVAGVDRSIGVRADDDEAGLLLLQVSPGAAHGAAGSDAADEMGDAPLRLVPDLRAGGAVVRLRVHRVVVLIRLEGVRNLPRQPLGDLVIRLRRFGRHRGRADHDLRAVRAQQISLLLAHLVRHGADQPVALDRRGHGETDAGVAAGRLDERPTRLEQSAALGVLEHRHADAILHRIPRVRGLDLRQQQRPYLASDAREVKHRRVADQLQDVLRVPHDVSL